MQLPAGWERVSTAGPGRFVTTEVFRRPDGAEVRWRSRRHRKASAAHGSPPVQSGRRVWWRPDRRSWWMAVLYSLGSLCFTAAALAAQWSSVSATAIGITFFVGSLFFTSAAYLQYSETVNVDHRITPGEQRSRWRPASWEPGRIDWLAALVQLIGTVFFNISTFVALDHSLTAHQARAHVWRPDVFGSIAFLLSSELAFAEVCHRWVCFRGRSLSWKIVALNLLGSIAFGVAAIASYVVPSSGQALSFRLTNAGTALGGFCFLIGALLLIPESAQEEQAGQAPPPTLASGGSAKVSA